MKTKSSQSVVSLKPVLAALLAAKNARNSMPGSVPASPTTPATANSNTALNGQNRRVLAQHYRAKYGVK